MSETATGTADTARKSERTREDILAAAARLFRRKGPDAATLRHIAAEAGVEAGSIYYHFASKEEIVDQVLDRGLRDILEAVRGGLEETEGAPFRRRFAQAVETHLAHLHAMGDFTSTNVRSFSQLSQEARNRHRPLRRDYAGMWDGMFAQAQAAGEIRADLSPPALRRFVLGAMNYTVEWFDPRREPVESLAATLSDLALDGICREAVRGGPVPALALDEGAEAEGPGRAKAERTREAILHAAARLIRDRGYTAATLRAIAAEAQVEAGSIYYHFPSKTAILEEVLDRGLRDLRDDLAARMARTPRGADHRARIAAAIDGHLRRLLEQGDFTSANIRNYGRLSAEVRARHRPIRADYAALWERLLEEAQDAGVVRRDLRLRAVRALMLGALNWTVEWFDADGGMSLDAYSDMCVALMLDGIARDSC